jgi:hypothetical protein
MLPSLLRLRASKRRSIGSLPARALQICLHWLNLIRVSGRLFLLSLLVIGLNFDEVDLSHVAPVAVLSVERLIVPLASRPGAPPGQVDSFVVRFDAFLV